MKPELSHYLELQFSVKIFTLSTAQFQPFFESILERKYEDFERIRTYGNRGDGGNDGYRKENGIYYQVYSPLNPESRDKEASEKMRDDFLKLHKKWNHVTQIKEFNFVFNDKFLGVSILLKGGFTVSGG
ncbi:MAG: hypothetical protein Q7V56_15915 [Gammaproteobacteria bacterium]|nr:hypothetical protein [Gammaproteobacteria bacterium]